MTRMFCITLFLVLPVITGSPAMAADGGTSMVLPPPPATTMSTSYFNDNNQLHDILGPIAIDRPNWWYVTGGVLLLLILLVGVLHLLGKKKSTPEVAQPPWDTALADLDKALDLLRAKEQREYINRISQILRRYIETRFGVASTTKTTGEFFDYLERAEDSFLQGYKDELQQILGRSDLAKFAHQLPQNDNLRIMGETVRRFIEATKIDKEVR